ncbi:MAG: hypothetical protein IT492_05855 [Gammaproteobacteria bacterium]|nr:hypothetical protein [Gammaproteobacteria bacterium]
MFISLTIGLPLLACVITLGLGVRGKLPGTGAAVAPGGVDQRANDDPEPWQQ